MKLGIAGFRHCYHSTSPIRSSSIRSSPISRAPVRPCPIRTFSTSPIRSFSSSSIRLCPVKPDYPSVHRTYGQMLHSEIIQMYIDNGNITMNANTNRMLTDLKFLEQSKGNIYTRIFLSIPGLVMCYVVSGDAIIVFLAPLLLMPPWSGFLEEMRSMEKNKTVIYDLILKEASTPEERLI